MSADLVLEAVFVLQTGDRASARLLLEEAIRQQPDDEQAWLWLSGAVESDEERLECLQQVLTIDPDNQAAQAGMEVLSHSESAKDPQLSSPSPAEASLDAFLSEQEDIYSINPLRSPKPAPQRVEPPAPVPKQEFTAVEPAIPLSALPAADPAPPNSMVKNRWMIVSSIFHRTRKDTTKNNSTMVSPVFRGAPALRGLLEGETTTLPPVSKKPRPTFIPWKELPISRDQVLFFGLGLVIVFLALLIGFSILKTVLFGPRVLAAPVALPTPTELPTPVPEPTPLVYQSKAMPSDCRFNLPAGARVECLTIVLPESRDGSSARAVRLPLVIYHSQSPLPSPDPVIYLHGGPDASAGEFRKFCCSSVVRARCNRLRLARLWPGYPCAGLP
jgi:hypothetical protein